MKEGKTSLGGGIAFFTLFSLLLLFSIWFSLSLGQLGFTQPSELIQILKAHMGKGQLEGPMKDLSIILWKIRLPRIALALLVGANLAVAGALMQALFYNPLAEPYIVGVSAGAALGAVVAMILGLEAALFGLNGVAIFAFIGATGTTFIVYRVAQRAGKVSISTLLLTGIAVGGLMQALTTLLILQAEPYHIRNVLAWLMGSLAYRDWDYVIVLLPYTLVGLTVACYHYRTLNALATGEESAHYLGVNVERAKLILLLVASLLAASAVAVSGIIAFVGLIVPHLVRILLGANHRILIPASILVGSFLVMWADIMARTIAPGQEIPIGVVTGVLGCLFFLYLLRHYKGRAL